jgi:hypothetical protein
MNFKDIYAREMDGKYSTFENGVKNKLSPRPDMHAFILLDKLFPNKIDMVSAAEHDQIWLDVDPEDLSKVATEEQMIELVRCGVMYDIHTDSLSMYV